MNKLKQIFFYLIFLTITAYGQETPVEITTTVIPPYSVFLSDYLQPGTNKIYSNLIFKDFNETSWDVRLKIKIQSNTTLLQTKPNFRPTEPITLYPGINHQIKNQDFIEYFDYNNLILSGITATELGSNGKLPEGYYTISIQAFDYISNKALSQESIVSIFLQLGTPPIAIKPIDEDVIIPTPTQEILFQWQPATSMIYSNPADIKYSISLYEILNNESDPKLAINNNHVEKIFESDYSVNTNFIYNINNAPLERGKKYAYRIHVVDDQELGLFKNDGYSEPYWFYYGYPEGGSIEVISPENNHSFGKHELGIFNWNGANNLVNNQELYYKLKIVIRDSLDPELAIEINDPWFERTTNPAMIHTAMSLSITQPFIPLEEYAWQVTAHTADQTVASSDILAFTGPPQVEYFIAGNKRINVTQTINGNLNHFSGKGTFLFTNDGIIEEIEFNDIQLVKNSGRYIMEGGEIIDKITSVNSIPIEAIDSINQSGEFIPDSLWFSRYNLKINGVFKWNFPHPVNSFENAILNSKKKWHNYNSLKIYGDVQFNGVEFDLLSPYNFKFNLFETSTVALVGNKFKFYLKGKVELPPTVKKDTGRVFLFFDNIDNVIYFNNAENIASDEFDLLDQTGLKLRPLIATVDFDQTRSPEKFSSNPSWKGIYYNEFTLESSTSFDNLNQLSLNNFMQKNFTNEDDENTKAWITTQGVTFHLENNFGNEPAKFNKFPSQLSNFLIDISNNTFNEGHIKGSMKIPIISETNDYSFTVPITANGFNDGYLDVSLDNQQFTFNPDGGNQLINFTIKRAVFAAKERLDLTVDLNWPSVNITMENVDNFRLWGNYDIGFIVPNGKINLSEQVVGALSDFQLTSNIIGCGRSDGFYAFGTVANVVMSEDVSGPDGAPQINLYSICSNSLLPDEVNYQDDGDMTGSAENNEDQLQIDIDNLNNQIEDLENINNDILALLDADDSSFETDSLSDYSTYNIDEIVDYNNTPDQVEVDSDLNAMFNNLETIIPDQYTQFYGNIKNFSLNLNGFQKVEISQEIENIIKLYTKSLVDSLSAIAEGYITSKTDELNNIVISKTDSLKKTANTFVYSKADNIFTPIEAKLSELSANLENDFIDVDALVLEVVNSAKTNLINEINMSVNNSIDNNLVYPFTTYVNEHIRDNIKRNIVDEISNNLYSFIDSGINNIDLDIEAILVSVGEEMINNIHLDKAGETVFSLVEDAVNNIDLNNVYNNTKNELMAKVANVADNLENIVEDQITDLASQMLGNEVGSLASNVSIDFDNVGTKIQDGDLSGIIKIDPTNISVSSSIVDFVGTINYTEGDPIYGNIWLGDIDFVIKVPDKDKGFGMRGVYMNGKVDGYGYWFCQLDPSDGSGQLGGPITTDAKPLSTPLMLGPVKLMGASGRLYSHMRVEGEDGSTILPDNNINYGASLSMVLFDAAKAGQTFRIGAKAAVEVAVSGDYVVDFDGNLQLKGKNPQVNEIDETAMIRGALAFNYNSAEQHFVGSASVISEGPSLCLDANMEMDVKPSAFRIAVGSQENRIIVVPGCAGYSPTGWLILDQSQIDLGLGLMYSGQASSPWIGIGNYNVSFFAEFYVAAGINAIIVYKPSIKIKEAGLWAEAWAAIGANYTKKSSSGTWTLAEAFLSGYAKVVFDPKPVSFQGGLSGYVKVLCIEKGFDMSFSQSIS